MHVFEEYLLDADWSLNAGNWMWLSASAFFHQYFRVYSPIAFGKKTDKNGDFIRLVGWMLICPDTGPRSAVSNMSDYRWVSDCRSRGCGVDHGPVPFFHGD